MFADKMDALRKARRREDGNVHRLRRAVENPFGHAETRRGRDLESRAAESTVEPEAFGADRTEGGMLIGGDAVVAAVRGVESAPGSIHIPSGDSPHGKLSSDIPADQ